MNSTMTVAKTTPNLQTGELTTVRYQPANPRKNGEALGPWAEGLVADYLTELGWQIIARNWRCNIGEIDLIALDPSVGVVFVEVKCRTGLGFGDPLEAITYRKQHRLRQLAACWLAEQPTKRMPVRMDAIGVLAKRGHMVRISHLRGI